MDATTTSRQEYSLDQAEFARTLRLGLGRVVLFLQQNDSAPHRDIIIRACLDNDVFDYPMNSDRQQYLFDVVFASSEGPSIRRQLIDAMKCIEDVDDGWMLAALVRMFAQTGDQEARDALIESIRRDPSDHPGLEELVELDGLNGLVRVAEFVGDRGFSDPEHSSNEVLVSRSFDRFGEEQVWNTLESASQTSSQVALFTSLVRERREQWSTSASTQRQEPDDIGFDQLRSLIIGGKATWWFLRSWGKWASDGDVLRAAEELLTIQYEETRYLSRFLMIFGWRAFPLPHQSLVYMATIDNDKVQSAALAALTNVRHPDVRQLGLQLTMSDEPWVRGRSLDLVNTDPQPNDHLLMEAMIVRETDDDALHWIGMSVRDAAEKTRSREFAGALLKLYERSPCAMCRTSVVNWLIEFDALPNQIALECLFDAAPDTRESAQEYLAQIAHIPPLPELGEGDGRRWPSTRR